MPAASSRSLPPAGQQVVRLLKELSGLKQSEPRCQELFDQLRPTLLNALRHEFCAGNKDAKDATMLKLVGMCMHSAPGLYGDGEGWIVGPFLLVLVTALAEPRLSFLKVQIMKTIQEFIDLIVVDSGENAFQSHLFLDLLDLLANILQYAHNAHEMDPPAAREPVRCLERIGQHAQRGISPADAPSSLMVLHTDYARTVLYSDIVCIAAQLATVSPVGVAGEVHAAWELACRTVLNCPYATSSHLLKLLACLCEQFEAPANLSDMLCQTLAWAIRCEALVGQHTTVPAQQDVALMAEAKNDDDVSMRPSAQNLARCIEAAFHTLPAIVRHVHAENMVPWTLDCLTAEPPRNLELRRALLGAFATSLCESPSLVPNMMRLSDLMHELALRNELSHCFKRILVKLLASPAHCDAVLSYVGGDRERGEGGSRELPADVKPEHPSDGEGRVLGSEPAGAQKRARSQDDADVPAGKRQSTKSITDGSRSCRGGIPALDQRLESPFQELVLFFLQACLKMDRSSTRGEDDAKARRVRGVLVASCIIFEFARERLHTPGSRGGRVLSNIVKSTFFVIWKLQEAHDAIDKMSSNGNLVLLLQALRIYSGCKLTDRSDQFLTLVGHCIAVCTPLVSSSSVENSCSEQLLEMITTLGTSTRPLTSEAPVELFQEILRSFDGIVFAAALEQLPCFILRCPTAASCMQDWVSLLQNRFQASESSSAIKAQIVSTLAHLLCAFCAMQSLDDDTEKAIKCEAPAGLASSDPVENFRAKQFSYSEASGRVTGEDPASSALERRHGREIWCCIDICAARYGSAATECTLPFPNLSQRSSGGAGRRRNATEAGKESVPVQELAMRIFDFLRSMLKEGHSDLEASLLKSVLWALPRVVLHLPDTNLKDECWLLECCLQIASGPGRCLEVRSYAAAAIASFASGSGRWLTAISGHQAFFKACDTVIEKVRDVYSNLPSVGDSEVEFKAAGCIQVQAFMGASIHVRNLVEGSYSNIKMICSDLVTTAVQNLADGNFRKSCATYGALEFVAIARGMTVDGLLSHSSCREDIIVNFINCMSAEDEAGEESHQDMRMIRAYLNLFGDGTEKGLGDDEEYCRRWLETIFKDVAHRLLMENNGQDKRCKPVEFVARYLQLSADELLVQNLQYVIKGLCFALAKPEKQAKVVRARQTLKFYTGADAEEHTREQPICHDFLLRNVLYEVAQYTKKVDREKGCEMISTLCGWLSNEKGLDRKAADLRPLEVILGIPKHQDFYTKWMFELNRICFEDGKLDITDDEIHTKRLEVLRVLDFTIPLLGKVLENMLIVILGILSKAKLIDDLKESVCDVWYTLITNCGSQSKFLKSRLPQIVITLLQLGCKCPKKVRPSLQLLLIDWMVDLRSEYKNIPEAVTFKKDELKDFTDILSQERQKYCTKLPAMLQFSIDGLKSEDDDLQIQHLLTLQNAIHLHFRTIWELLSGSMSKDLETESKDKLAELFRVLLAKCTHSNIHVRKQCVSCLGQLSAIEPSRIPPMERLVQNGEQSDDDLALQLVNEHLVRMLMASGSSKRSKEGKAIQIQGNVTVGIQELLKVLEIDTLKESMSSPAKLFRQTSTQFPMSQHQAPAARSRADSGSLGSDRGRQNWTKIQHKNIIMPWLFTQFQSPPPATHEPKLQVFKPGMNYNTWVKNFCYEVVMRCKGSRGVLLHKIQRMLKKDYDLASFVLSPAVLHLICSGSEADIDFVSEELMLVLKHAFEYGNLDEGEVVEMLGPGRIRLCSSDLCPHPEEILGMELKLSLAAGESGNTVEANTSESRNIIEAHMDRDRLVVVEVLPPFSDAVSTETRYMYTIAKGECLGSHRSTMEGSTQVVFKILDDMTGHLEVYSRAAAAAALRRQCPEEVQNKKLGLQRFLKKIPRDILAKASCQGAAYDRALMYLEESIREQWQAAGSRRGDSLSPSLAALVNDLFDEPAKDEVLSTFHRIYAGLEDDDGLVGITKLRKKLCLDEKIKTCELGGDWNQALACHEQALKQSPCAARYIDYLQCLRNLGHLQAMLTQAQGEIRNYPYHAHEFRACALQAAWRLGRWDLVEEHLSAAESNADFSQRMPFESRLAGVLLAMHRGDREGANRGLRPLQECVMGPLAAASIESYQRAYPHMMRLHMINEIQRSFRVVFPQSASEEKKRVGAEDHKHMEIKKLCAEWNMRLQLTKSSMGEREPLLALRRALFSIMGSRDCVADGWLKFAKAARRAGHASTANSAILQAESLGAPMAFLERSKLQWSREHERHQALNSLRSCIDGEITHVRDGNTQERADRANALIKSMTLYWKWVQEIGLQQTSEVIRGFESDLRRVGNGVENTEKIHFMLGQWYESLAFPHRKARQDEWHSAGAAGAHASTTQPTEMSYLVKILEKYGESLKCGHKHIFQSLPRLLTLWFENSSSLRGSQSQDTTQKEMHLVIQRLATELPSYIWLSVYPQLISRITHPNVEVLSILKVIISRVLAKHPRQALWSLVAVIRSREDSRKRPAKSILAAVAAASSASGLFDGSNPSERKSQFENFQKARRAFLGGSDDTGGFAGELVNLCRITVGKDPAHDKKRVFTMSKDCRPLVRIIRDAPNQVIMPIEAMLVPSLPRDGKTDSAHSPFPDEEIHITGFGEAIDVMSSMQAPVKVHFNGSDGKEHKFLAKPKDDLRKDTRMMEFNTMINRLLAKDADARRKNLHLRTFTVIPMNESTGIIQWVDNTEVFRSIIDKQVAKLMTKKFHGTNYARDVFKNPKLPDGHLTVEVFDDMKSRYPPVFYRWFLESFPDPAAWTAARNTYVRTTAAWSMVGYVVGLGDRHTENMLFDSTSGACVHVDFACMFNKGESLKVPERVPFRLTHNMVDAMGVSGYGGGFERTCCNTMRVLRANRDALMNVLETCVHDPLVEFARKGEDAKDRLHRCERRLLGEVTRFPHDRDIRQVLSVEGQVESVIAEAVADENLHKMYRWWMAWY